ncbi:tRNA wybutosine-synthesizing protein 4-like [Glandiceps talaboti]
MAKTTKTRSDVAIQGTNDSSVVSKCSMIAQGYFQDDFLRHFVSKTRRRSPLINRGYYIRAAAVNLILKKFLNTTVDSKQPFKQIVSLGAGFDSAYFRLEAQGLLKHCQFFEVDFMDVAQRKANIIECQPDLSKLIRDLVKDEAEFTKGVVLKSVKYTLLGIDMTKLDGLSNALQLCGINFNLPTLFLSECVMTYMPVKRSDELIAWAAKFFNNSMFVTYEQILPYDAFGIVMRGHFKSLGSALQAIESYPTIESQRQRYLTQGWQVSMAMDMNELYNRYLSPDERQRIETLEPFDEFEEWHLKCSHYVIVCSFRGDLAKSFDTMLTELQSINNVNTSTDPEIEFSWQRTDACQLIRRFGHSCCQLQSGDLVVTGGFGEISDDGKHVRLDDVLILDNEKKQLCCVQPKHNKIDTRLFHTVTALSENKLLIFGGRTSPTKPVQNNELICLSKEIEGWCYDCNKLQCSGDVPMPRWRHSACKITLGESECVVIFGGRSTEIRTLGDCYMFNSKKFIWQKLTLEDDSQSPRARHSHSATTYKKSKMIIAGGLDADQKSLNSVYILHCDKIQMSWEKLLLTPEMPPRYAHSSDIYDNILLLLGGVSHMSSRTDGLTLINLQTLVCQNYSLPQLEPEYPIMLHNHSCHLLSKTKVCVIGGGGNCFSFGTHFNTTPVILHVPDISN